MRKTQKNYKGYLSLLLAFLLLTVYALPTFAEEEEYYEESYEEEEETEFIPEEYYDPIETNQIEGWPQGQAVQAGAAVVMDLDTDTLLYSKNPYKKMYPASITKIMTAMIALERGNLDEKITFSEIVYDIEAESSHQGIQPGEVLTLRQALYGLMLESANDIANGLAEHFGGSISGFADLMNQKASELGCVGTHFANPHGLHNSDHYTCAYDMALIAQAAYEIPEFRQIVSTTLEECPSTNVTEEERYFVNHHKMIQQESDYYRSWCTGGKTGFTSDAWNTLVTYGEKDGMRLVCVILHENGAGRSYLETSDLMNYGFEQFQRVGMTDASNIPTFYEAMKLNYPGGIGKLFQSEKLNERIGRITPGLVTIPNTVTVDGLSQKTEKSGERTGSVIYQYQNWPVGYGGFELYPLDLSISLPFEQKLDMEEILKRSTFRRQQNEIEETAVTVMQNTQKFVESTYDQIKDFVEKNTLTVICVGCFILLILLIMIVILILRCTKEYRMRNRRRQEEKELLRREEEIDRMTTAQIEQELREAMKQERLEREEEEARKEEERIQEEKLRETERILEEINGNNK